MIDNGLPELDCGLDGKPEEHVTIGKFNRWLAFAMRHHLIPLKESLESTEDMLGKHIKAEETMLAKIQGGVTVIKYVLFPVLILVSIDSDHAILKFIGRVLFKTISGAE
jgi:hypothetical protein